MKSAACRCEKAGSQSGRIGESSPQDTEAVTQLHDILPRTAAVIQRGVERNLHTGGQIYVARNGRTVADCGIGEARPGAPMTAETILPWLSAGKPLTAAVVACFREQGRLDFDDRVADHIPEFGRYGKETITLRHLLTHTSGLPVIETGWPETPWETIVETVYHAEPVATPGERAAYDPAGAWYLLGEILQRIDGRPYSRLMRDALFEPLGMTDTWNGMPREVVSGCEDRIGLLYVRDDGDLQPEPWHTEPWCSAPSPGGNTRGPIRELGRFYEMLLGGGQLDETRVISPETVRDLTSRRRAGMFDETFRHTVDLGLGFLVDSNRYGPETVPYGFGRYCSEATFGHGGAQCAIGFADPEHGLVVAWALNGRPGEPKHNRRNRAINAAIYEDLGLGD